MDCQSPPIRRQGGGRSPTGLLQGLKIGREPSRSHGRIPRQSACRTPHHTYPRKAHRGVSAPRQRPRSTYPGSVRRPPKVPEAAARLLFRQVSALTICPLGDCDFAHPHGCSTAGWQPCGATDWRGCGKPRWSDWQMDNGAPGPDRTDSWQPAVSTGKHARDPGTRRKPHSCQTPNPADHTEAGPRSEPSHALNWKSHRTGRIFEPIGQNQTNHLPENMRKASEPAQPAIMVAGGPEG